MGIRSRILLFQLIVVASVLMMAAIVYITIRSTTYYMQRVQWANNQLEAVTALTVNANRYSEQIAEFLLIGEPERPDYDSARAELEAGFDKLEKLTRGEAEFLVGSSEQEDDGDEIFRITRMRALYGEIGKATSKAIDLRNQGRQEEAVSVFRRDIENRFDAEFENILEAARRDEAEEVARTEMQAEALWRRLTWITVALTLAAVVLCFVAAFLLARSLVRPIGLLTKAPRRSGGANSTTGSTSTATTNSACSPSASTPWPPIRRTNATGCSTRERISSGKSPRVPPNSPRRTSG